jgi:hypothetical protein
MTTLILIPRRQQNRDTAEMVEIRDKNNYPCGLVHIDTFWNESSALYKKLMYENKPITVELVELKDGE